MPESPDGSGNQYSIKIAASVVAAILALLVVVFAFGGGDDALSSSRLLGQRVPPLAGTTLSGDSYDIDNERGRWVLVNFFATWCAPCVAEHPQLVELEAWGNETQELSVVSVVFDDDPERVAELFDELGGSWPVLDQPEAVVEFQIRKVPESFLVDPSGRVVARFISGVTASQVIDEIEKS